MGSTPKAEEIEAGVADAASFIDHALERYPVDRRKLVLLGFSQGGSMAYNLALRQPQKYAALVGLSTWFPPELASGADDLEALSHLPTLVQHGRADEMIAISRARQSLETMKDLNMPVVYKEYDCGHEITADGLGDLSKFLRDKVLSPIISL